MSLITYIYIILVILMLGALAILGLAFGAGDSRPTSARPRQRNSTGFAAGPTGASTFTRGTGQPSGQTTIAAPSRSSERGSLRQYHQDSDPFAEEAQRLRASIIENQNRIRETSREHAILRQIKEAEISNRQRSAEESNQQKLREEAERAEELAREAEERLRIERENDTLTEKPFY